MKTLTNCSLDEILKILVDSNREMADAIESRVNELHDIIIEIKMIMTEIESIVSDYEVSELTDKLAKLIVKYNDLD